jgi:predicted ATPase
LLAQACGQTGQAESGLTLLAEGLDGVRRNGECWQEAELNRLRGELLLLASGGHDREATSSPEGRCVELRGARVEKCFREALAIARRQEAKSLELRAAVSLARVWQQKGNRAHAYDLLAPIYDWFTEGFDTADLQGAKALLDELR